MKGTKFFGIGIALVACVLALLLAGEVDFMSGAFAGKPDKPPGRKPSTTVHYCYAMLDDDLAKVIRSDGNGQYSDTHILDAYGDKVEVEVYDDGSLKRLRAFMGKPELPYRSPRRVNFHVDLLNDAVTVPDEHQAVYDSLVWKKDLVGNERRGNLDNGKYYLDDGTVHFVAAFDPDGSNWCYFLVDLGCMAEPNPEFPAVTQTYVDDFYTDDGNPLYWTSEQAEPNRKADAHDHIIYEVYHNQLDIVATEYDEGKPITWLITPQEGATLLRVPQNIGTEKKPRYEAVQLATYQALPFRLVVSLNPLEGYTFPSETGGAAPQKFHNLSTSWGKLKTR